MDFSAPTFLVSDLEAETPWFALKFYPWPTLAQYHEAKGPMAVARTIVLAKQMMEFLGELEAKRILHLDVEAEEPPGRPFGDLRDRLRREQDGRHPGLGA